MIRLIDRISRPLLRLTDPEQGHRLAIAALKVLPLWSGRDDPTLAVRAFGLSFPNPVGLAAGFDKHGEVADSFALEHLHQLAAIASIAVALPYPSSDHPRTVSNNE